MDRDEPRAHHDMGACLPYRCLPVDREPHALTLFDKQVDAIRQIVARRGLMSVDELRRGIEALPPDDYDRLTYYQRWLRSITGTLLRKGVITAAELQAAMDRPLSPSFADGQAVVVRDDWPERHGPVHIRTPHYLRGQAGHIERCLGAFANPEDLAFGRPAATVPLYHVRVPAAAVWPEAGPRDDLLVEIFEHWLEPCP